MNYFSKIAGAINIAILGIVTYLIYSLTKKREVTVISESGATISDNQASIYSEQLFQAMQNFGTDENIIVQIFEKITSKDFTKIYNHFGQKGHLWGVVDHLWGLEKDLVQWLSEEIGTDYEVVNKVIRGAGFSY